MEIGLQQYRFYVFVVQHKDSTSSVLALRSGKPRHRRYVEICTVDARNAEDAVAVALLAYKNSASKEPNGI